MTEEEKDNNETHKTTGGYLKEFKYKDAFQDSYNKASKEERDMLLKLPNFDADFFFEISGVDVRNNENIDKIVELEKQAKILLLQIEELKKDSN